MTTRGLLVAVALSVATVTALGVLSCRAIPFPSSNLGHRCPG
jgi:hypothetical protein